MVSRKETNKTIAAGIKKTYLERIDELPANKKSHLAGRFFSVTGESFLIKYLVDYHQQILPEVTSLIDALGDKARQEQIATELLRKFPLSNKAQKVRLRYLKSRPEVTYLNRLATNLCYWKKFKILPKEQKRAADKLGEMDLTDLFQNHDFLLNTGVSLINLADYLKFLGIRKYSEQIRQHVQNFSQKIDSIRQNKIHYQNWLYGLTHFIINDTFYYEYLLDGSDYQWILNFFENNFKSVEELANLDVTAEVGLCCILCKEPDHPLVTKCQEIVKDNFEENLGMVAIKQRDFIYLEHVNVVSFLLLSCPQDFVKGPDLSKYFE